MVLESLRKKAGEMADAASEAASKAVDVTKDVTVNTVAGATLSESEKKIAQKMGITGMNLTYFRKEAEANKELEQVFTNLQTDMASGTKYDKLLAAFGTRFKEEATRNKVDTSKDTIIDLIGRDIKKDPSLGKKLEDAMKKNPDAIATRLATYKEGELANVISTVKAPAGAGAGADLGAGVGAAASGTTLPSNNKPKVSLAEANPTGPAAPKGVTAKVTTATASTPSAPQSAPKETPSVIAVAAAAVTPSADPIDDLISDLATNDGDTLGNIVKNSIDAKSVVGIGDKMAQIATDKYGVSSATTNGFKQKIKDSPQLAENIAKNFQNNPEFVKSLAKMSKDKSPLEEPLKSKAQEEMNKLMNNPELLAKDSYVKELQAQIKQAEEFQKAGGFMGMFKNMFAGAMGPMRSGFRDAGFMMSGFSGPHSVLSMSKGESFLPNIMVNLDAYGRNWEAAVAFNNYSPLDMVACPPKGADGKYFHDVTRKNAQGKDVVESVPNGQITLTTADGKEVKVIPSVGVLVAKQMAGQYDLNGKFVPGNIQVPVVTAINDAGDSSRIKNVILTPAEFAKYKQLAEAAAERENSPIRQLAFQDYTERDAQNADKSASMQVASINPATGTAVRTSIIPGRTFMADNVGVTEFGLAKDGSVISKKPQQSANDPEYSLQA